MSIKYVNNNFMPIDDLMMLIMSFLVVVVCT